MGTSSGKAAVDPQSSVFLETEDSVDSLQESESVPSTSNCDFSFSQVDKDVLYELPSEMQLELTRHFASRNKSSVLQTKSRTAFDQIMKMKTSPTKTNPLKTVGSKRGRKKGSTNKKPSISTSPKKPIKRIISQNNENLELFESNSLDIDVFNCLPEDIKNEIETHMKMNEAETETNRSFDPEPELKPDVEEQDASVTESETEDLYEIEKIPKFFGKSTIEDIRPMLKAWIFSNNPPNNEDIGLLSEFLSDLVKTWRIDLVQILLKCLYRNISKLEDESEKDWKNTWNDLVTKVQNVMISSYGSPLLVTEKF